MRTAGILTGEEEPVVNIIEFPETGYSKLSRYNSLLNDPCSRPLHHGMIAYSPPQKYRKTGITPKLLNISNLNNSPRYCVPQPCKNSATDSLLNPL